MRAAALPGMLSYQPSSYTGGQPALPRAPGRVNSN